MHTTLDMRPTLYTLHSNQFSLITNELYLRDALGDMSVIYSINEIGGLNRTVSIGLEKLSRVWILVNDMQYYLNNLQTINDAYKKALCAIGERLGWQRPANDSQLLDIRAWTIKDDLSKITTLDLSNLELTQLPPQIQLFKQLEELNLAGNDLHFLPPELQFRRETLRELDISGNQGLQPNIPEWLSQFENLHLIAYDMGEIFLPRGKGGVKISSDVIYDRLACQESPSKTIF